MNLFPSAIFEPSNFLERIIRKSPNPAFQSGVGTRPPLRGVFFRLRKPDGERVSGLSGTRIHNLRDTEPQPSYVDC